MIICKPHSKAFSSIIIFSVICILLAFWLREMPAEWQRFLAGLFLGIGVVLPIRLIINYRQFMVKKNNFTIKYLLFRKPRRFSLKELQKTELDIIKTFNGNYEQMRLYFQGKTVKISNHEYTNYDKLKKYIQKYKPLQNA